MNRLSVNRPLGISVVFFIIGIIGGTLYDGSIQGPLVLYIVIIISIISIIGLLYYLKKWQYGIAMIFMMLLGITRIITVPTMTEKEYFKEDQFITISGSVDNVKKSSFGKIVCLENVSIMTLQGQKKIRSKVNLKLDLTASVTLEDRITVYGKVLPIRHAMNPSDMNYELYLKASQVVAEVRGETILNHTVRASKSEQIKNSIRTRINTIFKTQDQGIVTALLLGEYEQIPPLVKSVYQETGIGHLLALSGFHLGIIGSLILGMCVLLGVGYYGRYILTLLGVWLYTFLIGMHVGLVRAAVVMSIFCVSRCLWEEEDDLTSLAVAAMLILYVSPFSLYQVGFQLSFICVLGIIIMKYMCTQIDEDNQILRKGIKFGMIPTMITPILAYHFFQVPLLATIMNIVAIPLFGILMIGIISILAISILSLTLAQFLGSFIVIGLTLIYKSCEMILKIPGATVVIGRPSIFKIIIYYLMVAIILIAVIRPAVRKIGLTMAIGVLVSYGVNQQLGEDTVSITNLYVGQGDGSLVITPQGKTLLIDGGSVGKGDTITRYLHYSGRKQIDIAVVSHLHEDHVGGIIEIIEQGIVIKNVITAPYAMEDEWGKRLELACKKQGTNLKILREDEGFKLDGIEFKVLFSGENLQDTNLNNHSLVCKIQYKDFEMLYTGDMENTVEPYLMEQLSDIDVLKVAHHGSKTSTSEKFLLKTKPEYAIISCGISNRYHHPHESVVTRMKKHPITLLRTDLNGSVMIQTNGDKIAISSQIE